MAGTLKINGGMWGGASWLFDWVLREVVSHVDDRDLAAKLNEIVEVGLGWLSLADLADTQRSAVRLWLRDHLVADAESSLPADLANRAGVIAHLGELADLAGGAGGG